MGLGTRLAEHVHKRLSMPVIEDPLEEQGGSEASDRLVLLVIALVIFHVGAFVSFDSFLFLPSPVPPPPLAL